MGGEEKKKVPQKKNQPGLRKRKRKGQPEFTSSVSPGTRRDEKGAPIQKFLPVLHDIIQCPCDYKK
jgi:hypothetical protein